MFHVKHPLQASCSILETVSIVLGKNFTKAFVLVSLAQFVVD